MAAPKPWESSIPMSNQPIPMTLQGPTIGLSSSVEPTRLQGTAAPPPPPRVTQSSLQQSSMGFYNASSYASPYSTSSFYGPQPLGYYNQFRPSMYGNQMNYPASSFSQLAMDESRSAFSSIESVIQTFRSISLMLESTFTSVYSSFRAVTDVFDHFARVRTEIAHIYPLVLIWRFLKYIYHRLLRILRLHRSMSGHSDESWSQIYQHLQETTNRNRNVSNSSSSSLLVALFFLVSVGTPMLMFRILNAIIRKKQDADHWLEKEKNPPSVVALYDYTAQNPDELSFTSGATIYLAPITYQPSHGQWFIGSVDRIRTGLIPANYVQVPRNRSSANLTLQSTASSLTSTTPLIPAVDGDNARQKQNS